jgi:hypothetical protein
MVKLAIYGSATWLTEESGMINIQNVGQENLEEETVA